MSRLVFFLLLVSSVLLATTAYVVRRGMQVTGRGLDAEGRPRRRPWLAITGSLFLFLLLPWLTRIHAIMHLGISERLSALGFVVGLAVVFSAALIVPIDLAAWLVRRVRRGGDGAASASAAAPASGSAPAPAAASASAPAAAPAAASGSAPAPAPAPTLVPAHGRRSFLERAAYGTAIATGAGHAIYAVARGRHDYALEELVVRVRDLPPQLEGLTIAQISDVHIGTFVGERELAAGVELIRQARPDLIALTGDLVDHDPRMASVLGRFARNIADLRPRFGVHGIAGNHDYYTDVDVVLSTLREAGVNVLRNSATEIRDGDARIALLGTDDVWAERDNWGTRYDLDATLTAAPRDCPRILLCHNPERFDAAAPHVDLQLSGHTHGGQVNFVMRPADLALRHGFVAGHYVRGEGQLYVNRGFGTVGPPARLYAPPEVTKITLVRA